MGAIILPSVGIVSYVFKYLNQLAQVAAVSGIKFSTVGIGLSSLVGILIGQKSLSKELKKLKELERKAQQNDPQSQFLLGLSYQLGEMNPIDDRKALQWYQKAADQGYASAINNLGIMYQLGKGVTQSGSEALNYFQKAIKRGSLDAYVNLGNCYEEGLGVERDFNKAQDLYQTAAEKGFGLAMLKLGLMFWNGKGFPIDLISAYMWIELANIYSQSRNKEIQTDSLYIKNFLQNEITHDQIALSEDRIKKWKESHPIPVTL